MLYADQMPPAVLPLPWTLVLVSVIAGLWLIAAFRLVSRPDAIRRAWRRVESQLLALRLFGDEPALVWKAQVALLAANARFLAAMSLPIAAAALPLVLAWPYLEALYGRAAIPPGADTVLTVRLRHPAPEVTIETPPGLRVVTPAVRIAASGEIAWRLHAEAPVSQPVRIHVGQSDVAVVLKVGNGLGYLAETTGFHSPEVQSVRVVYRAARLKLAGVGMPWEIWLILISSLTALAAVQVERQSRQLRSAA